MSLADEALWIIERNSARDLTLGLIAKACKVSRSHLANAFGTATGWPVMKYLRARRLSEAARQLANGAPDILAVALDYGYGSHEAFTRAFRDQFATTPEKVRSRGSVADLDLTPPLQLGNRPIEPPAPALRSLGELLAVGVSTPCSYGAASDIPAQWQQFVTEHYDAIPDKLECMPIGICQAPDEEGCFAYMCAAPVSRFGERRSALTYLRIEPRQYAVFEHAGHVSAVLDTYTAIWNEALPRLGRSVLDAQVLEFHNEAFDPRTGQGGLTIWIPIEA
jgi:AraC family transcriptional regulator